MENCSLGTIKAPRSEGFTRIDMSFGAKGNTEGLGGCRRKVEQTLGVRTATPTGLAEGEKRQVAAQRD